MRQTIQSMHQITAPINDLENRNEIRGNAEFINSKVIFEGKNNILIFNSKSRPIVLENTTIKFGGSNSVVFIGENNPYVPHMLDLSIYGGNKGNYCYIGDQTILAGYSRSIRMTCTENANIFIGNECLIADASRIKTSDGHPIYDISSKSLLNHANSVLLGDHIWIGLESLLLKGTMIGSGAIIGARSLVSKNIIPSNSVWAGTPLEQVRKNIFHLTDVLNDNTPNSCDLTDFIYTKDCSTISLVELDKQITDLSSPQERANFITLFNKKYNKDSKNRFCIIDNNQN